MSLESLKTIGRIAELRAAKPDTFYPHLSPIVGTESSYLKQNGSAIEGNGNGVHAVALNGTETQDMGISLSNPVEQPHTHGEATSKNGELPKTGVVFKETPYATPAIEWAAIKADQHDPMVM